MSTPTRRDTPALLHHAHPDRVALRPLHERWLADLTQIPSASGREHRVIRWIRAWADQRQDLRLDDDPNGNLTLSLARCEPGRGAAGALAARPIYITAHLDHPAFVVEDVRDREHVVLSFRGGVMADYFRDARVVLWNDGDQTVPATLTGKADPVGPFDAYNATLDAPADLGPGDVGVWDLGPARTQGDLFHTLACDDLAAAAAALAAFDMLATASRHAPIPDVRLLFTRAEEIGFVGAIAACRSGTVPAHARVINLENSRSFAESPIGGGPIVRVGDRMSVFTPSITDAIARVAETIAGAPSTVTASQKLSALPAWKWQRKLMAGGACESSVFCAAGYEATCVCLPLGNYHNMADLDAVQAGANTTPPRVAHEFISLSDFHALIDLLVACALDLPEGGPARDRFERLWRERAFVLDHTPRP